MDIHNPKIENIDNLKINKSKRAIFFKKLVDERKFRHLFFNSISSDENLFNQFFEMDQPNKKNPILKKFFSHLNDNKNQFSHCFLQKLKEDEKLINYFVKKAIDDKKFNHLLLKYLNQNNNEKNLFLTKILSNAEYNNQRLFLKNFMAYNKEKISNKYVERKKNENRAKIAAGVTGGFIALSLIVPLAIPLALTSSIFGIIFGILSWGCQKEIERAEENLSLGRKSYNILPPPVVDIVQENYNIGKKDTDAYHQYPFGSAIATKNLSGNENQDKKLPISSTNDKQTKSCLFPRWQWFDASEGNAKKIHIEKDLSF